LARPAQSGYQGGDNIANSGQQRMAKLNLSVAVGDYDRTRALIDGSVAIDGVDPVYMTLVPEEIFFRAFRAAEFDI
jgi:4,5-dihydroxyphthalate decarboxylase